MTKKTINKNQKSFFLKLRVLPWYWKCVASLVVFFLGGTIGTQAFTAADDLTMALGFIVLVIVIWVMFQIWLPVKQSNK